MLIKLLRTEWLPTRNQWVTAGNIWINRDEVAVVHQQSNDGDVVKVVLRNGREYDVHGRAGTVAEWFNSHEEVIGV